MHVVQQPGQRVSRHETPATLDDALRLLAEPAARAIAGGTDLIVELARGGRTDVSTLVDLTRIPGLDKIELDGDRLIIGALTPTTTSSGRLCASHTPCPSPRHRGSRGTGIEKPSHHRGQSRDSQPGQRHDFGASRAGCRGGHQVGPLAHCGCRSRTSSSAFVEPCSSPESWSSRSRSPSSKGVEGSS